MNNIIESILDSDLDIRTSIDAEIDNNIRKWLHESGEVYISNKNHGFRRIEVTDYKILNHKIYVNESITGVKIFNINIPEYIRFGYVGKEFGIDHSTVTNIENILKDLDRKGLKELRYVDISNNYNLKKMSDLSKMKDLFCLTIENNSKLIVDINKLADTFVSIKIVGNKNQINIKDLDARYIHHITELDNYNNREEYNTK